VALNGKNARFHFAEHSGLVATARSYFQDAILWVDLQEGGLVGNRERLRDGLIEADGEGLVVVGTVSKGGLYELVSRDGPDRVQNALILDAPVVQGLDQTVATPAKGAGVMVV
jgi:hypothetical protein